MKVLHIIASVNPEEGGPVENIRSVATMMRKDGHHTEVVTLDDPSAPFLAEFPFPAHGQGRWMRRYGYTPKLARWIRENAHRFDIAVVHGLWNHSSIGGWQGLKKTDLPYIIFVHGMMAPWFRKAYPLKHWAKQALWLLAQGKVLRDAGAVLFTAEEERIQAKGVFFGYRYNEKVIAYGVTEPPHRPEEENAAFRAAVPGLKGRKYLLFLSRIHPKKGCDLLVKAFAKFASRYPDTDLVIAGPDQVGIKAQLQAAADNDGIGARIHWPGMIVGDAKWGAFRNAEAFILPSHQENFGIVVAEAMSCGTPVLTTNQVNIWREVAASGGGVIETDTLEGTVRLFESWLSLTAEEKKEMSQKARKGFEDYFDIRESLAELMPILNDVISTSVRSKT